MEHCLSQWIEKAHTELKWTCSICYHITLASGDFLTQCISWQRGLWVWPADTNTLIWVGWKWEIMKIITLQEGLNVYELKNDFVKLPLGSWGKFQHVEESPWYKRWSSGATCALTLGQLILRMRRRPVRS